MASNPLANTESNVDGWKSIQLDANEENAMTFLDKVTKFGVTSKKISKTKHKFSALKAV